MSNYKNQNRVEPGTLMIRMSRDIIAALSRLKIRFENNNYAFWYIALLSRVICANVDSSGRLNEHILMPQFYITPKDIVDLFGVKSLKNALFVLDTLKNDYDAIDYYCCSGKIWIHCNIGLNSFLSQKAYFRKNKDNSLTDEAKTAHAINNNEGYFSFCKLDIFLSFFKGNKKHGILDLFILLFLNKTSNNLHTGDSFPEDLNGLGTCLWRVKNVEQVSSPRLSFYVREEELAHFINVDKRSLQRHLKRLEDVQLISVITMMGRGVCIVFRPCNLEQKELLKMTLNNYIDNYNDDDNNKCLQFTYSLAKTTVQGLNVHPSLLDETVSTQRILFHKKQPSAALPYDQEEVASMDSNKEVA